MKKLLLLITIALLSCSKEEQEQPIKKQCGKIIARGNGLILNLYII